MTFPSANAKTMEYVDFLIEYNHQIHNAILEGQDYRTLINDLIEAQLGAKYTSFRDAVAALHFCKLRYYAGTRDITYEVEHVLDSADIEDADLDAYLLEAKETVYGEMENFINYLEGKTYVDTPPILYDKMLEKLYDFPICEASPLKTITNMKVYLQKLEEAFLDTTHYFKLPLVMLSNDEKKLLQSTTKTNEIEGLVQKIFDSDGGTTYAKKKGARNISGETGRGSHYTINRHLEAMGVYRKQYYRFLGDGTIPSRILILAIALYLVPNHTFDIEDFMNIFGYSIKSNVMSIAHKDISPNKKVLLLDKDIRKILYSGLDTDIILMLLAEKNNAVKNSASSKNFS
ncbi:MAG: hypothetical protein E7299_02920 [Lachnospiraceae bacterium]|nr:hypothetical protein [Lachnospiraceae bacterium]